MDDGSLKKKGLHLSVYGFTYNEVLLIKEISAFKGLEEMV
jgi:hypothetical protein